MVASAWYGRALIGAGWVAGVLIALVPALWMWGFTVDDALISLRYAHHLATGAGYRWNALGRPTDGVTPLGWPLVVLPLSVTSDLTVALFRTKILGIVAWSAAGGVLGGTLAKRTRRQTGAALLSFAALLVVGLAFPVGAWAASGMETGLATALATVAAAAFARPRAAAVLAGLATALRPELLPWALVVAAGASASRADARVPRTVANVVLASTPFMLSTVVRLCVFGRAAPLAILAKPSDLAHGLAYAPAAAIVVLTPILVLAPVGIVRASPLARTLALAGFVHVLVVLAVGGDWMPYGRLMVPVAPSLALAFVDIARTTHLAASLARLAGAFAIGAFMLVQAAPAGRHVYGDRNALVERARPALAGASVVAALDVGWVGAATEATIIDLAGLTDPEIAVLPGGHTSKAVDLAMLLDRGVDTIVVYGEPRLVERRLLASPLFDQKFVLGDTLALGTRGQFYRVYRRR